MAVVGGGMAGILSAIRLREAGIDDVVVYEKADRLGGTWRENTYPGVACDVPSHLYSYSFAPNPEWRSAFSGGPEILRYLEDVAGRFGVDRHVQLGTEVRRLVWEGGRWSMETSAGAQPPADVVIAATGVLHHPAYPDLEGLERFAGPCFHTARWNHDLGLDGARIGIVGTGSSAVQVVGALAARAGAVHLFQRTAQWVLPVPNPPVDDAERQRLRADPSQIAAIRSGWSKLFEENFANAVVDAHSPQLQALDSTCRSHLERSVRDDGLREKLRPDYQAGCKRLVISPNFYEAVQQPNVHLVTDRIAAVEPDGVRTVDGALHELDVLVLATGFRVDRFLRPMDVVGRGGLRLDDVWARRPSAYLSISVPGFPNLFMLNGPNGPVGNFSLIEVAELQFDYIAQLLALLDGGGYREVSATAEAAARFEDERTEATRSTVWSTGCRSWYLDDRGVPAVWPWTFDRFRREMAAPDLAHFELVPG
ncbi:MAG TPA: NAD(P)/FAD-dependent oxidoreductase [Acidimicrobiales bacterium]|nr:NAD(P)/FAD-dependent oxidoreductase [Acidimicrobiales bacterium]